MASYYLFYYIIVKLLKVILHLWLTVGLKFLKKLQSGMATEQVNSTRAIVVLLTGMGAEPVNSTQSIVALLTGSVAIPVDSTTIILTGYY